MARDPKLTHAWDQAIASLAEMAADYYAQLMEHGLSHFEALAMCIAWQRDVLEAGMLALAAQTPPKPPKEGWQDE